MSFYAYVIARQWRVILAGLLVGAIAAIALLLIHPPATTATTVVSIRPISLQAFDTTAQSPKLLDSSQEAAVAGSFSVAAAAAEELGLGTQEVVDGTAVSTAADSSIVRIAFTGRSSAIARDGADAVAIAYLAERTRNADEQRDALLDAVSTRISVLQSRLGSDSQATGSAEQSNAAITAELGNLLSEESTLGQLNTSGGSVLTAAADNTVTTAPSPTLVLVEGLLAGGVVGLVGAFVLNRLDTRIRSRRDIDRALDGGIVASVEASDYFSNAPLEPYRGLAEQVLLSTKKLKTLVVVDGAWDGGPSISTIGALRALAESGRNVELVTPHIPAAGLAELTSQFDLVRSPGDELSGSSFRSRATKSIFVHVSDATLDDRDVPELRAALLSRYSAGRSTKLFIVVLPFTAAHSLIRATLADADASLAVSVRGVTRSTDLQFVAFEIREGGGVYLGTIDETRTAPTKRWQPGLSDSKGSSISDIAAGA